MNRDDLRAPSASELEREGAKPSEHEPFLAAAPGDHLASDPVIVLGAPRSGTTYLMELMNTHPQVFITHETRLFTWAHRSLRTLTQENQALCNERDRFIEYLEQSFPALIRNFYGGLSNKRYWGDKNPHYANPWDNKGCMQTILDLFPGARFVHIVRDGRDVVASLLRKGWVNFGDAHRTWTQHVDAASRFGAEAGPGTFLEVRYERLVADGLGVAEALFDFLGIPFADEVAEFCGRETARRTPFSSPMSTPGGPPLALWLELFDPSEQSRSLEMLLPHLVRFGYVDGG